MASCPKCGSSEFKMETSDKVEGSNLKWNFVTCAACDAAIGVLDFYAHNGMKRTLEDIEKRLRDVETYARRGAR